ncbi:PfkB family carbohydrate kinase [Agrobacterium pusense]|uniref:PfkB family carbohydrate kinase n=1 Tax=Agrobacterium pusense TaxID=648995 RepID=UPI003FD18BBA
MLPPCRRNSVPHAAFDINVTRTCGCGDAFNAGFAAGLLYGLNAEETTRLAQASSVLNATGLGSKAGIVNLKETLSFIEGARVSQSLKPDAC